MKINKLKSYVIAASAMISILFTSCDEVGEINVGGTSTEQMAGDWWVVALEEDGVTPAYGGGYVHFTTYNTSSNDGNMWLDDNGEFMEIKTKVMTNTSNKTFSGEEAAEELITGGTVTVTEGSITEGSYTTTSNSKVDEIMFKAEFDWEPGTVFIFKGHRRTGFAEDEDPTYSAE
jgi:hypothetical protein